MDSAYNLYIKVDTMHKSALPRQSLCDRDMLALWPALVVSLLKAFLYGLDKGR